MTPEYLLSLRLTTNALIERAMMIRQMAHDIDLVINGRTISLEPIRDYGDEDDQEEVERPSGPLTIFSETVLRTVMTRVYVSNTLSALRRLRELSTPTSEGIVASTTPPSIDGWGMPELRLFVQKREDVIVKITEAIRDAHTSLAHSLPGYKATLPREARERVAGGGDLFQKVEITFDPRRETKFFERGFLAAWLDEGAADHILGLLARMTAVAAPLEGEPPSLTYFGSHVSNRITIDKIHLVRPE